MNLATPDSAMRASAEQLFFEGNAHLAVRGFPQAEACFRKAVSLAPALAEAHANLAWVLAKKGRLFDADRSYRQSLALNPTRAAVAINHGALLASMKRFDEAEHAYRQAIANQPESAAAWSNLGALYLQTSRYEAAERCCSTSIALDPCYDKASVNLSYLCLLQGRYDEGWRHYEARPWRADLSAVVDAPCWAGESIEGKSLLIGHEGGLGDAIQFCRYVSLLKEQGAGHVALVCPAALIELFRSLDGVDDLFALDMPIPRDGWHFWTSSMSLPLRCGSRVDDIPATLPYLRVGKERASRWMPALPTTNLRVGLAWRGNAEFENDADRSIHAPRVLAALGDIGGVSFISLQQHAASEEASAFGGRLQLDRNECALDGFLNTAALVQGLDLVISVDTSIAHLAGALGKPCWLMLPHHLPDWRWLQSRTDSPWYPGVMRLFRQPKIGDWPSLIGDVRAALVKLVGERSAQAGCNTTSSADAMPLPTLRMTRGTSTA